MGFSAAEVQCAANIVAIARKYRPLGGPPELVHLAVTLQESDWDEGAAGDAGQSFGPYQLYLVAHPSLTREVCTSPWYDYAYPEMHDRWKAAWERWAPDWTGGRMSARGRIIEAFAPDAQGSIAWPNGLGASRYATALLMLEVLS